MSCRPLSSLPRDRARALIASLAPALGAAAAALLASPADPDVFAVDWGRGDAREPAGVFALRPLRADAVGRRLAGRIRGPAQARFPGPHGLAGAIAVRTERSARPALRAILAAIGHTALGRMYGTVFFHVPDRRVAAACAELGVEPAAELAGLGAGALLRVYAPDRPANLARLRALDLAAC